MAHTLQDQELTPFFAVIMPMFTWQFALAKTLYPLPPPPDKRTKDLKVICCGLPRSGTESLHTALEILEFSEVAHGFPWWFWHINNSMIYYELAMLRAQDRTPNAENLRKDYFDRLLADCEATTDVPTVWFCEELLTAYPNAKVILNRRRDTKAWKDSFRGSVLPMMQGWTYWIWSWFNAELFWGMALTYELHNRQLFKGDFENNAEQAYDNHFERLQRRLDQSGRPYLDWSVEDGWSPLCRYLEKEDPHIPFPEGNVAAEFGPKLMVVDEQRMRLAKRNAALTFSALICLSATVIAWFRM